MASGLNLWMWLECIGVVSGCCCKEVYNYIDIIIIIFPYNYILLVLALFCQQHPYNVFSFFIYTIRWIYMSGQVC